MKFYEITDNSEYGEQPAKDSRTGERVTLTDKRAALMSGAGSERIASQTF